MPENGADDLSPIKALQIKEWMFMRLVMNIRAPSDMVFWKLSCHNLIVNDNTEYARKQHFEDVG